jgi:hypothetical protein
MWRDTVCVLSIVYGHRVYGLRGQPSQPLARDEGSAPAASLNDASLGARWEPFLCAVRIEDGADGAAGERGDGRANGSSVFA